MTIFDDTIAVLRVRCPHLLRRSTDPLAALVTGRNRHFFMPVLYALIGNFGRLPSTTPYNRVSCRNVVSRLKEYVSEKSKDGEISLFADNLYHHGDWDLMENLSQKFSYATLEYCAANALLSEDDVALSSDASYDERMTQKVRIWIRNARLFEYHDESLIAAGVRRIVTTCFPLVETCFPPSRDPEESRLFAWDPFDESWRPVKKDALEETLLVLCRDVVWTRGGMRDRKPTVDWKAVAADMTRDLMGNVLKTNLTPEQSPNIRQKFKKMVLQATIQNKMVKEVPEMFLLDGEKKEMLCVQLYKRR